MAIAPRAIAASVPMSGSNHTRREASSSRTIERTMSAPLAAPFDVPARAAPSEASGVVLLGSRFQAVSD
jgi:hypothetical protein